MRVADVVICIRENSGVAKDLCTYAFSMLQNKEPWLWYNKNSAKHSRRSRLLRLVETRS